MSFLSRACRFLSDEMSDGTSGGENLARLEVAAARVSGCEDIV